MGRASIAVTVPEVGACTGTLMTPCASAIVCPPNTRSPKFTMGKAGTPRCWRSGSTNTGGMGAGSSAPGRDNDLRSGGWMPP